MKNNINRRSFIKNSSLTGVAGIISSGVAANTLLPDSELKKGEATLENHTELPYNKNRKLKIVQFADTHYISGDPRSERALKNVNEILDTEKPDLVIHTGDVIFGSPAEQSMREILEPISKRKIPFAVTFGNHDDEFDKTREELYEIVKSIPYSLTSTTKGISGVTNYILTLSSSTSKKTDKVLYFFDSNTYSKIDGIKGYDHINFDQIRWYRKQSQLFTSNNGNKPVPSLAFFHIPLPEYKEAARNDGTILMGTRGEAICSPEINSGMFVSMKEMGDVQAMFVGHDHNNDFAAYWKDMFFIYGRFSGCDTVYNDLKPNGARIIELTEGEKGFRSWVRLYGGEVIRNLQYPDNFVWK